MTASGQFTMIPQLPVRPPDGHKGSFGRLLVIGGNEGMLGAPVFAGTAALRMGSGLVQLAVLKSNLPFCLAITPELIGLGLEENTEATARLMDAAEKADAIVIGPGLGTSNVARQRLLQVLLLDKPIVVDADGLNLLATESQWPSDIRAQAVLTPHPGEMARLIRHLGRNEVPRDEAGRQELAVHAARVWKQVVVLKGHRTVVSDGLRTYVNHTGDNTLAKAGTGDVLSGIIGSLLGQGMKPFEAAVLGTHLHGLAGEAAGRRVGPRCALARDVIDSIREVVTEFEPS